MFLIVANLAVYIVQTFLLKTNIYQTEVAFFTLEIWTVLSHMTLPLCIFYRFFIDLCAPGNVMQTKIRQVSFGGCIR